MRLQVAEAGRGYATADEIPAALVEATWIATQASRIGRAEERISG
jgi:hypothetical protein